MSDSQSPSVGRDSLSFRGDDKKILQIAKHLRKSLLSRTSQAPRFLAPDIDSDNHDVDSNSNIESNDHDVDSNGNDQDHDVKGQDVDDNMMMVQRVMIMMRILIIMKGGISNNHT